MTAVSQLAHIKCIALDLDGTLLDGDGKVPAASVEALKKFGQTGGLIAIATGMLPKSSPSWC